MAADQVSVGFIGCGENARRHMRAMLEVERARVAAVCDLLPERAESAAAETGAQAYTDHRAMLERPDLDAVCLSIPVHAHGAPEFAVIERGLPFLVEKPVARDRETAHRILAAAREKDLLTAVGYQLRYSGTCDLAREILADQRIGLVSGRYWHGGGSGDPNHWLRQLAKSGGQIVEQATHTVDMMRYLAGEIVEVHSCQTRQVLTEIDCPDFSASVARFASGAVGALTTAWCYARDYTQANLVDVLFEDARLEWNRYSLAIIRHGERQELERPGPGIDEVFIHAVRTGDRGLIRSDYEDAVRTLEVTLAMNESAATGKPVRLGPTGGG